MTNNPTAPGMEPVEVTQQDREAAADLAAWLIKVQREWDGMVVWFVADTPRAFRAGAFDAHEFVQAFARHRLATSPIPAEARPAPEAERVERAAREAITLIDEINKLRSSRDFYGITTGTHGKLATIRATLAVALAALPSESTDRARVRELEEAIRTFIKAHDASALSPDDVDLEGAEIDRIGDLRAALTPSPSEEGARG